MLDGHPRRRRPHPLVGYGSTASTVGATRAGCLADAAQPSSRK